MFTLYAFPLLTWFRGVPHIIGLKRLTQLMKVTAFEDQCFIPHSDLFLFLCVYIHCGGLYSLPHLGAKGIRVSSKSCPRLADSNHVAGYPSRDPK